MPFVASREWSMILRMSVPDFEIQALVLAFCSWFLQIMVILCVVVHSVDKEIVHSPVEKRIINILS